MDKKLSGILLSSDCFLWTNVGLATVSEIEAGDTLLGVDINGKISTFTIKEKPILFGPKKLINFITEYSATILPGDCEVYSPEKGIVKVDRLDTGDHIEVIGYKAAKDIQNMVQSRVPVKTDFQITEQLAYLFGRSIMKKKMQNKVYFRSNEPEEIKWIAELLKNSAVRLFGGKIYHFGGNEICCVSSKFFDYVSLINLSTGIIPRFLRLNGLSVMRGFFQGVIDKNIGSENIAELSVSLSATRMLQFIKDIALLFNHEFLVQRLSVTNGILATSISLGRHATSKISRSSYAEVLTKFNIFGPAFLLSTDNNWEPIVDNMLIHRHALSYVPKKELATSNTGIEGS